VDENRHAVVGAVDDLRQLAGLVFEFARLQCPQRRVGDDRGGVDDHVRTEFGEVVGRHRVRGPRDDELVAATVTDVLDGRGVGVDVGGEDQYDVTVLNLFDGGFVADVGGVCVEVLIAKCLDATLVAVENLDLFALGDEFLGHGVAHTPASEDGVARHRRHRDAGTHASNSQGNDAYNTSLFGRLWY
jgi:hypothetical protein